MGLLDLVEKDDGQLQIRGMVLVQLLLGEVVIGIFVAISNVAGRGAEEPVGLMLVLKVRAVDRTCALGLPKRMSQRFSINEVFPVPVGLVRDTAEG